MLPSARSHGGRRTVQLGDTFEKQGCAKERFFGSLSWRSDPRKVAPLLLCQGHTTRSLISPAQAQIGRKPPWPPATGLPWLSGGDGWLESYNFFFLSRKRKQFDAGREESCSLLATSRVLREPYQRHGDLGERKHSQACGDWEQEGDLFVND